MPFEIEPRDAHNTRLLGLVHPPGYVPTTPAARYQLVVIGGGPAGLVAAAGAAGLGAKVALIERGLLGGDCLNYGCVPSKALLRSAKAAADARRAGEFGVRCGAIEVDFHAVMERLRKLRADLAVHDSAARFRDLGIDVFLGSGKFVGPDRIAVGEHVLTFRKACIAVGARPALPPIPGLAEAGCLTNETVFNLTRLPRRLAVLGAGPIGCELAQAFARLGSETTLLVRGDRILPKEDLDLIGPVLDGLRRDGVRIVTGAMVEAVEAGPTGRRLLGRDPQGCLPGEFDEILIAVGRTPHGGDLGLDAAGVAFDPRTGVQVDARLRTKNPRVFAAGDCCSEQRFTHAADFMARLVLRNALFGGWGRVDSLLIPRSTYTDPEIASVGLTEQTAAAKNIPFERIEQPFAGVDRAVLDGDTAGSVKILVSPGGKRILGAAAVGPHAGDLLGELTLAMQSGVGPGKLANVIHPYPTCGEAVRKLGDRWNRTRLTPFVKGLLNWWLKWIVG